MLNVVAPSVVVPSVILICFYAEYQVAEREEECLWYKYADREREQKRKKNSEAIFPICLVSFIFYSLSLSNAFSKTAPETASLSLFITQATG